MTYGFVIPAMAKQKEERIDLDQLRAEEAQKEDSRKENDAEAEEVHKQFVPWLGEARPKKGSIYDMESKIGSKMTVEFMTGRVIEGTLVSYDRFMNLLLDDTVEILDDGKTRALGRVFSRGKVEALGVRA